MKISKLRPDRPTPPLRNKKLWKSMEQLRLIELKNAKTRGTAKRPKSGAVSSDADMFVGDKKRGTIYFSVSPEGYHATLMPMVDFFRFQAPSETALVRQIMEWITREYVGAVDLEFKPDRNTSLCQRLNRELRSFSADNRRNKIAPAGRTLSRAYMPGEQGVNRHA